MKAEREGKARKSLTTETQSPQRGNREGARRGLCHGRLVRPCRMGRRSRHWRTSRQWHKGRGYRCHLAVGHLLRYPDTVVKEVDISGSEVRRPC